MQLVRFPRAPLAHLPTPFEFMPRLTRHLGGPRLYIKRDDCTGLATGGNKTRKLEYLIGDALAKGADTLITAGAVQSNHTRQTAAAAAKLGLGCEHVLVRSQPIDDPEYERNGNVLLNRLLGAELHLVAAGSDAGHAMAERAEDVRRRGGRPYIIPVGGSNVLGALGYLAAAREIEIQADAVDVPLDYVVTATASGSSQSGLVVGFAAASSRTRVLGINVYQDDGVVAAHVRAIAEEAAELIGLKGGLAADAIAVNGEFRGSGYGRPSPEMVEAVELAARLEGIVLDPVYTGKAFAGLLGLVRGGYFKATDNIAFLHTGGVPELFVYRASFA
ncbi:MAG: D-cysteine desulfhydrase [Alphaproteobacteria bacterium]|nr:D-cysteine desulfhydrase [Alphaproteobacteria bacterium]